MATGNYAIKDAIDLKITALDDTEGAHAITIDYLNTCSLSVSSDTVYAQKKGNNAIAFDGQRTCTFTMESHLINDQALAWLLGGELGTDGSITVKGTIPNKSFKIVGTFCAVNEAGNQITKEITMNKAKPQVNTDTTFSATDVSSFSIVFDVLVDAKNEIIKLIDKVGA